MTKSVGEVRAEKSQDSKDWTLAELCRAFQRDHPDAKYCIIAFVDEQGDPEYYAAGEQTRYEAVGLLELVKLKILGP